MTTNNINGKQYVGLSSDTPEESMSYLGSGKIISYAIKKYGSGNFTKEILHNNITNKNILGELEIYYIQYYGTYNNGYNLTLGGEGSSSYKPTRE